ncbi:MAG: hypothetical protein ABII00_03625 [Elusimicrobiota bacterium]
MRALLILLAIPFMSVGCVTIGRPFDVSRVPEIRTGKTTEQDLLRELGGPYRRGLDDGDATATWVHYRLRLLGARDTRDLYVRFSADGTVKSYSFNSNFPEDREVTERPGSR